MRDIRVWFFLSCKRYLKKWPFLVILLLLPIAAFWVHSLEKEDAQLVRIAVCVQRDVADGGIAESPPPLEQQLAEHLVQTHQEREGALFQFYICDTEEQLKADVASRKAECGYVISENLRGKLDQRDYRRSIQVYSAPSTVLASLSTEVVFSSLMELYDREIFVDYVVETAYVILNENSPEIIEESTFEEQAGELYDKWLNGGKTFQFAYRYQDNSGQAADLNTQSIQVFPVRGIIAVYLFLTGLYSAVMLGFDEQRGLFLPLPYKNRMMCQLAVLAAPVFLAGLSGFAALAAAGSLQALGVELAVMGAYIVVICGFAYAMKLICKKPQVLCCTIPLFLVGSLLFTPVFVDIGQYFPDLAWVERLFLPGWYLRLVEMIG